jgi:hypothetical protein
MTEIGRAARGKKPVSSAVFAIIDDAAAKAPLAPEPFLVRGVQAQLAGNPRLAIQAFAAAAKRDPRSLPAHYFLADTLFRSGDTQRGLEEITVLARLSPNGVASLAPYVAAYAKDPRTWPQLRELFRTKPDLKVSALTALAADPANADTVLALAAGNHEAEPGWLPTLLNNLVAARQYAKAHEIWVSIAHPGITPGALIYDAKFNEPDAPGPFNWILLSSSVGLSERRPGGGLHVIFYGREDGLLARQLLVLPAGRYRVTTSATGNWGNAHPLSWAVRCDGQQTPLGALPLDVAAERSWSFTVPANCPAQWLELSGVASDVSQQVEATISQVSLIREHPNG